MKIIGLTGGIGSGKSSVARWFRAQNVPVLDADAIVHGLMEEEKVVRILVQEFGEDIIGENSRVDRRALGAKVFNDDGLRRRLEAILHPLVLARMQEETAAMEQSGEELCVWDVPLLYETDMARFVSQTVVVWVPEDVQVRRVIERDRLAREAVLVRMQAQMPIDLKKKQADVVIDNSGEWAATVLQLEEYWDNLRVELNQ